MTLLCLETPENIEELQAMLRHYQDKNVRIRVVGAQHSCEDATHGRAFGERDIVAISMTNFDTISIVDDRRRLKKDPYALVRIEAGVHIAESPYIHPVPKPEAQLYRWLEQHGLALPVVGGVAHQTVVGFLATGSGGGSQTHCIHDTLVAVELVDGHGERKEFRRDRDPEFAAAGVSLGLLGVVVSVTLKLGPRFQVYGKEVFARWTAQDPVQDTHDFLNKHEYARMIWWPQTKVVQRWSCERVIAREDFHANPYVPVGLKPFERQVVTNVLLTLSGNLESIGDLRGVANKLRASRVIEYQGLVDVHERIRPVAARETTVEVLQRPTHFHWTRSRFRPRRRSDLTPRSAPDLGQTVKVVRDLALASERLLARAVLAAGDEIMKRLFYNSQGHEIVDPTKRRQVLDTYGDFFSNLFATDRDVGPIRAERVATQVEKWGQQLFGSDVKLSLAEVADYFGEMVAAQLVPIEDETPDDRWSKLLLAIVRRVVYTQMPAILSNFFAAFTDTTTGFCDWDFNGLAVDRALNHHLVQTKFSSYGCAESMRMKPSLDSIATSHQTISSRQTMATNSRRSRGFRTIFARPATPGSRVPPRVAIHLPVPRKCSTIGSRLRAKLIRLSYFAVEVPIPWSCTRAKQATIFTSIPGAATIRRPGGFVSTFFGGPTTAAPNATFSRVFGNASKGLTTAVTGGRNCP